MKTEDLVINQGSEGEIVEEIGKILPDVRISVFSEAFVVEAVYLSNLAGLVISAQDGDTLRISDFEGNKECDSFDRVITSIDVVTF